MLDHTEPSCVHVAHIGRWRADHRGSWADRAAAVHVHSSLFQVVAFLSWTLGATDVCLDCAVQWARVCGAFLRSSFILCILTRGLGDITQVSITPFYYPVTASTFNFACTIFGSVSIFAVLFWYFISPNKWLRQEQIERALHTAEGHPDPVETPTILQGTM